MNLNFLDRLSKNTPISNVEKIRTVGAELFHADGRTDRRTDGRQADGRQADGRQADRYDEASSFCESAWKRKRKLQLVSLYGTLQIRKSQGLSCFYFLNIVYKCLVEDVWWMFGPSQSSTLHKITKTQKILIPIPISSVGFELTIPVVEFLETVHA
jgi:hypothetical protein